MGALALVVGLGGAPAAADECASYGVRATIDGLADGDVVPANGRLRVGLFRSCGEPEGAVEHELRLVGPGGAAIEVDRVVWGASFVEVAPRGRLGPGRHRLEVRRPLGGANLGPWEALVEVEVGGADEQGGPRFAGIAEARARAVPGAIMLSPCEATTDWVIETSLSFETAVDDLPHDRLLYALDRRRGPAEAWQEVMVFRPEIEGAGRGRVAFTEDFGWSERWEYRIRVRDLGGYEVAGARTAAVTVPGRPKRPVPPWRR